MRSFEKYIYVFVLYHHSYFSSMQNINIAPYIFNIVHKKTQTKIKKAAEKYAYCA